MGARHLIQVNPQILVWRVAPHGSAGGSGDTLITCLELMTTPTLCLKYAFSFSEGAALWSVMITL